MEVDLPNICSIDRPDIALLHGSPDQACAKRNISTVTGRSRQNCMDSLSRIGDPHLTLVKARIAGAGGHLDDLEGAHIAEPKHSQTQQRERAHTMAALFARAIWRPPRRPLAIAPAAPSACPGPGASPG